MTNKRRSSTFTAEDEIRFFRAFASWAKARKADYIKRCTPEKAWRLKYTWAAWARDNQLAPEGDWATWCILAGRGWGKTRTGAEKVIDWAYAYPGCHIALVGRTVADVRDVMIKGRSGILAISPPWFTPKYEPSKRLLTWPNGTTATTYSADEPDQLRGPQHSFAWADERAAWQYDDAWDQLMFGLRIAPAPGVEPRAIVTTTPRNTKAIKELVADPTTHVTYGHMRENAANLAARFLREIERKYAGTRLGRQEIEGAIIDDIDGALWKRDWIERSRLRKTPVDLVKIVVAIDPPATSLETSEDPAEAGIVVVGKGTDGHGYVLADMSMVGTPNEWAEVAIRAYLLYDADLIVGEVNNGGEMILSILRTMMKDFGLSHIPYETVRATRGKQLRAEPISTLYQRDLVHHVGTYADLEDQQCNWVPGMRSPDRLDALVWACTKLMIEAKQGGGVVLATPDNTEAIPANSWEEIAGHTEYY
jgi:phage terminase large subunit-like protein